MTVLGGVFSFADVIQRFKIERQSGSANIFNFLCSENKIVSAFTIRLISFEGGGDGIQSNARTFSRPDTNFSNLKKRIRERPVCWNKKTRKRLYHQNFSFAQKKKRQIFFFFFFNFWNQCQKLKTCQYLYRQRIKCLFFFFLFLPPSQLSHLESHKQKKKD